MMKNKMMKKNKLAIAILALSLAQAANAEAIQNETDNEVGSVSTFWGVGIGSVIGAVIAGPPGAAIGATLGGSIGWGQDKDQALDQSLVELERHELVLGQTQAELNQNKSTLIKTKQVVSELSHANAQQSAQLANLMMQESDTEQTNKALQAVIGHYAQEVYFRNGESGVPVYAEARLNRLTDFLTSHPNLHVLLKGYTDQRGSADFNETLAQARVDGIKDALLAQGVDASRVSTKAIGETESLLPLNKLVPDSSAASSIDSSNSSGSNSNSSGSNSNSTDYVLDRRVSIELSISDKNMQPIASIEEVTL